MSRFGFFLLTLSSCLFLKKIWIYITSHLLQKIYTLLIFSHFYIKISPCLHCIYFLYTFCGKISQLTRRTIFHLFPYKVIVHQREKNGGLLFHIQVFVSVVNEPAKMSPKQKEEWTRERESKQNKKDETKRFLSSLQSS